MFKPLLADPMEFDKLDFTNLWVSPKYDGIRMFVVDGKVISRNLKPFPNKYLQHLYGRPEYEGLDGEIGVGDPTSPTFYNTTFRGVKNKDGEPDFTFHVFDSISNPDLEYWERHNALPRASDLALLPGRINCVPQFPATSLDQLLEYEAKWLAEGYEGLMGRAFRGANSKYKFGRSTAKQGTLTKLKRLEDFEAVIVGVEEQMANNNEATIDELGRTKRSSHQENKWGKGTLGALICRYAKNGELFRVGIFKGYTAADLQALWNDRENLPGQPVKLQKLAVGEINLPRHPRVAALGLRMPIDM